MEKEQDVKSAEAEKDTAEINPDWAHNCIVDLDEWIESQGIYLRQ